ncbi:TIGR03826 family flagellar region protein [Paenibacillus tarimensis]
MNLDNCPRCGKLFAKNFREVCVSCIKDIDREYEKCATFLRENRGASIYELSEETGVSVRQITKFIREGRISLINAPNMSYPCEVCATLIREGNMCTDCRAKLIKEVRSAGRLPADETRSSKSGGAYQIGDRLRND